MATLRHLEHVFKQGLQERIALGTLWWIWLELAGVGWSGLEWARVGSSGRGQAEQMANNWPKLDSLPLKVRQLTNLN